MSTTQILVLIVVLLLLLFAISRYFIKQDYRSKGGAPFILYKSDIEKIYNAIYDNSISLKDYGLDDDDKVIIEEAFDDIVSAIGKSFETKRNLDTLDKSLHSLKARYEQLKSLEQKVDESHNKRLETNALKALENNYSITQENEHKASDFYKNRQLKTAFNTLRQQARINKETNVIDEVKEGIEYESRECHIHKVGNESSSEFISSISFDPDVDVIKITEPNTINEFNKAQGTVREIQPTINPIEQQTEHVESERSVNKEREPIGEEGIAEASKNETTNNDDNNGEQNNQSIQQNIEVSMDTVDEKAQEETEEHMNPVDKQEITEVPEDISGGRGLSIYNYGFLEAYIHFKIIEGVRLIEVINRMNNGILRIQCTGNYILDIIPVQQQFVIPFDWRRKEGIKKTSICTSFDIYRAKDRDNVEWCIYKGVDGNKDFEAYLNMLQNLKPVSSDFLSD